MSKYTVFASWDEAPHLSAEAKAGLISAYLPNERDARTKGIPSLGSGAIYPIPEEDVLVEPFVFPAWYRHAYALDVGWNRTAGLWLAYNVEEDVGYLYSEYYRGQAEPAVHAEAIKSRGAWIPGVVDPKSRDRSQRDGEALFALYTELGLILSPAINAVEAGIYEVWSRLSSGRLKVFSTLQNFRSEYRIYRRGEDGKVVKENDHLMDGMRYLCMSGIAIAALRPFEEWAGRPGMPQLKKVALEAEHDPFAAARNVVNRQESGPRRESWGGIGGWGRE
jgi:hypothetical protein